MITTKKQKIMTTTAILLNTRRTGYSVKQILDEKYTLTVGELMNYLSDYDPESPVLFSNDDGYTYGEIDDESLYEVEIEEDNF